MRGVCGLRATIEETRGVAGRTLTPLSRKRAREPES